MNELAVANVVTEALERTDDDPDAKIIIGNKGRDFLLRLDMEEDRSRLRAGAALLNTFNFAIQVQAGRQHWSESDFHRFIRAYIAIDGIGRNKSDQSDEDR